MRIKIGNVIYECTQAEIEGKLIKVKTVDAGIRIAEYEFASDAEDVFYQLLYEGYAP